jgi:hypothetical protein
VLLWLAALLGPAAAVAQSSAPAGPYAGPLVVTRGGVYSGFFRSTDSAVPCVTIDTDEPVILENCVLAGAGHLVYSIRVGAQLTVRNCRGYGLTPSQDNRRPGYFLLAAEARAVQVEHNSLEHIGGVFVHGWAPDSLGRGTLTVVANEAHNIDGRYRNPDASGHAQGAPLSFLFLDGVHGLEGAEVAWNQVVNEPGQSFCYDVINFHNSGGTARSPIRAHNNYLYGAFALGDISTEDFEGAGIICDGDARTAAEATQYILAADNVVVATTNAGMNIAAGHHVRYLRNRIVGSARARLQACGPEVPVRGAYCGLSIFLADSAQRRFFGQHVAAGNVIGYMHHDGTRRDVDPDSTNPYRAPRQLPLHADSTVITLLDEAHEWQGWQARLAATGVRVGAGPCAARGSTDAAWISQVELGGYRRRSGPEHAGYFAATGPGPGLAPGTGQTITLQAGFARRRQPSWAAWRVYADWNHDLDFDDAGERVVSGTLLPGDTSAVDYRLVVPPGAQLGRTHLRVLLLGAKDSFGCGSAGPGEVEDYTVEVGYCTPAAMTNARTWIARLQLGSLVRSSGPEPQAYFFEACPVVPVAAGSALALAAQRGGPLTGALRWQVYADWNRDLTFSGPNELLLSAVDSLALPLAEAITVPLTATAGPVRLRVVLARTAQACSAGEEGEVEDYTLLVTPAAPVLPDLSRATPELPIQPASSALQLYPNPVTEVLHVLGPTAGFSDAQVLDSYGRRLGTYPDAAALDVRHLPPGLYLLQVRTAAGIQRARFLKQ